VKPNELMRFGLPALLIPVIFNMRNGMSSMPDLSSHPMPHAGDAIFTYSGTSDAVGSCVLQRPRGHKSTGKGRNQARDASEISFHSLRHSAVTMLKAAGVSDFMAREIVATRARQRQYTHLTTDDKRAAMQRLPDVTRK
jgi:integrase